jgi:hypothetical protein
VKSVKEITAEQKKVDRTANALKRLRVTRTQLAEAPEITTMLKRADGGMQQVYAAMRFSPDDVIFTFLKKYDAIPSGDREHLPIEAIALAAGVDIRLLLGSILVSLQAQAVNTVKVIAMTAHPKITEARVAYGQLPFGEKDRNALDVAMGFLPSPKGPTFIGKAIFGSGKNAIDQQRGDDDEEGDGDDGPDLDRLFPPANAMQQKLTPIRQKMLPAGQ